MGLHGKAANQAVTESCRHTVSGICRFRGFFEFELLHHHEADLVLGRITTPDDSFLDLPRSILCGRKFMECCSQENNTTSMSQLERTLGVFSVENIRADSNY